MKLNQLPLNIIHLIIHRKKKYIKKNLPISKNKLKILFFFAELRYHPRRHKIRVDHHSGVPTVCVKDLNDGRVRGRRRMAGFTAD